MYLLNKYLRQQYIMTNKKLLCVLLIIHCLLPNALSKLRIAKLITVSEALQINTQSKFKFTDVMMTEKTASQIKNSSLVDRELLPGVQINNIGRIDKRYHQLGQDHGVYILVEIMDQAQIQNYFQNVSDSSQKKIELFVLEQNTKGFLSEDARRNQKLCFVAGNLTAINKSTEDVRKLLINCLNAKGISTQSQLSQKPLKQTSTISETIIICTILLVFSVCRHVFVLMRTKKDSVI